MELLFYFLVFFIGAAIGSFLNVIVYRIQKNESFLIGRSYCDNCNKKLAWHDLIPLFSYLILAGKCRYCRGSISIFYPVVEKLTGIAFVLVMYSLIGYDFYRLTNVEVLAQLLFYLYITSCLLVIFLTDLKYGIIPFKIVLPAVIVCFVFYFFFSPGTNFLVNAVLCAIGAFLFFFLLFVVTKGRGLGFGDVVYVFLMGLLLGAPKTILGLYIAFLSGAVISVVLVLLQRKKIKGGTIPFGPFLVTGTFISMIWGDMIVSAIMGYLM